MILTPGGGLWTFSVILAHCVTPPAPPETSLPFQSLQGAIWKNIDFEYKIFINVLIFSMLKMCPILSSKIMIRLLSSIASNSTRVQTFQPHWSAQKYGWMFQKKRNWHWLDCLCFHKKNVRNYYFLFLFKEIAQVR